MTFEHLTKEKSALNCLFKYQNTKVYVCAFVFWTTRSVHLALKLL